MKIHPNGYWQDTDGHGVDPLLATAIANFLVKERAHSVLDLGCGNGYYTGVINNCGVYCLGVDGNPLTPKICGENNCIIADLTEPRLFGDFEWVLSLEVGEHIPVNYELNFINNIHNNNTKGVIMSWAVTGQGGDGHVNCRENEYIKALFRSMGYWNDLNAEGRLRACASIYPNTGYWFKDTLMVFRNENFDDNV